MDDATLWNLAEQTPALSASAIVVYWFLRHLREEREFRDAASRREEERRERIESRRIEAMNRICDECRQANRESTAVIRESTRVISLATATLESLKRDRDRPADDAGEAKIRGAAA